MNTVVDGADGVCHQAPCPSPLESTKSQSLFTARLPWWRGKAALTLTFLLLLVACSQQQPPSPMLPPEDGGTVIVELELQAQLAQDETTGYLIYFRKGPDLSPAYTMSWEERGRFVMQTLQAAADASQVEVRAYLDAQGADYQAFWVDNLIVVENSDLETFNRIRTDFPEIQALKALPDVILIEPDPASGKDAASPSLDLLAVVSNISHVKAPDVWAMGFTGEGITVASIDTGVRYTHQALVNQYRGNLGGGSFDHNYSWWNPYASSTAPSDSINHGSHVTGTMVGDDGGDNQIGMAPGAKWIACMGFNPDVTDSGLLECAQFMLAPWDLNKENPNPDLRPHVVNNSWGDCKRSYDSWYQGVVDAWHAAGIYPVFSAGNAGSCFYFRPPGLHTIGNPARYGNVTAVGSTDNGQYATHSNWGPTDNLDTVNPRGYPDVKPQVVAPGVGIRSSTRGSDSAYTNFDGTSMAAPHVAGLVALMWQAAPCLVGDYGETETIIEETATPIAYETGFVHDGPGNIPNQATGWGEINALGAVQSAQTACGTSGTLVGQVTDANTGSPVAGANVLVESNDFSRTRITNAQGNYSLALPAGSYKVTVSRSRYESESANVTITKDQTTQQDFSLPAGRLIDLPTVLEATVAPPSATTLPFILTNSGGQPVNFSFAATTGLPTEHFEGTFPPSGWTVINHGTSGAQCGWQRNDTVVSDNLPNPRPNFAGGDGFSAAADSDACGEATTTDSELRTPVIDLSNITTATLSFIASYSHSGASSFRVDISTDGGGIWTNLLTWNSSRSGQGPGEAVSLDLAPYLGSANTIIRFRYLAGWDWWAQIDQVSIQAGVPWLSFIPASGTVGKNGSVNVNATFDASSLSEPGQYTATLEIDHDTPYTVAHIPVTMTVDIGAAATTTTVSVNPTSQQYSDLVTLQATVGSTAAGAITGTVQFKIDGVNVGSLQTLSNGSASLVDYQVIQAPGERSVTSEFTSTNSNFADSASTTPAMLIVTQEDARATYTGLEFVTTASANASSASVQLSATIQDITAVTGDPAYDANAGDIRNARVTFVNRDNGNSPISAACSNLTPSLVSASDTKTGTVACNWSATIGNSDSQQYRIGIMVNGHYTRNHGDDDLFVTVSKPINSMITGGGHLINQMSEGQYAGGQGLKTNIGFNVKYNRNMTNLQGNVRIIIRTVGGTVYQIKANAMNSLTTNINQGTASFMSKANLTDITDPLNPVTLSGNLDLQMTMKDNGNPGTSDLIGITLRNSSGALLFSSRWNGTATTQQNLSGGNLIVR